MVLTSFFEWGFCLSSCEFLRGLLHHCKIELVHLNPNSILQLVIFIHTCECYLTAPNFSFFMYYFILKYQVSVAKRKIISNVGIQTCLHRDFLDLPLKFSSVDINSGSNAKIMSAVFPHLSAASPNMTRHGWKNQQRLRYLW
jgi:hypothetical protein